MYTPWSGCPSPSTHVSWYAHPSYEGTPPVVDAPPPVHMCPGMHTPRYEGTPPVVDAPPPVHMCPGMHTPRYEGTPPVVDAPPHYTCVLVCTPPGMKVHPLEWMPLPQYTCVLVCTPPAMKVHPNAIKIGNPTSQCALLGLKLVQLSTLAGRIFFCHRGKSSDGVGTNFIRSIYGVKVHTNSVLALCVLHPNFASSDKKKSYQSVCSIEPISSPIEHTGW